MATILRRTTQVLVVVILGALAATGLVGAPGMAIPAGALGVVAGIVAYIVVAPTTLPRSALRATAGALARRIGAAVALVVLATSGVAVLLGDATGPVLLFAAMTVIVCSRSRLRPALAWARARRRGVPAAPTPSPTRPPADATLPSHGAALSTFGTSALCATWQRSYHHLDEASDERTRDALLDLRRRCLDEFERRDPAGTARWLATELRPAGTSPLRHLNPARPLPPETSMASTPAPPHLNNHHRGTLDKIFAHPAGHNIEWPAVLSLLEVVGTVEAGHDGRYLVTLGAETETLEKPRHKDIDTQQVVDLRRMLSNAGYRPTE